MSRYFLKQASIEGFRGINNEGDPLILRFRPDCVNSVHAPNGVGKSSIFEALNFAIHGAIPRLESLQGAEQGPSYIVNKFHPRQQATIELLFGSDDATADISIVVTRTAAGARTVTSPTGHADPESFLISLREDFVLVDYPRFASFVDSTPLDRGRSFASLVGLSRYSGLRQSLERARDTRNVNNDLGLSTLESEVTTAQRAIATIEYRITASYQEVTGTAVTSISGLDLLKANVTTSLANIALFTPLLSDLTVMELDFEAAEQTIDREEGGVSRKSLDNLNSTVATLNSLALSQAEIDDFDSLLTLARSRDDAINNVGAAAIHSLLKDALSVVAGADWHDPLQCPVCENVSTAPIKDQLEAKVALYDEAERLDTDLRSNAATSAALAKLRQLEECAALNVDAADRIAPIFAVRQVSITTADLQSGRERLMALEARRSDAITRANNQIEILQASLPPSLVQVTRILGQAKQFRNAVLEYERDVPLLETKRAKLAKINRWKSFIGNAAQVFATSETTLANARIADIQTSCQELFGQLVRGGPNVQPTLSRAQNSENVDLKLSDFYGLQDQSARALLSESYRNAVAAAIFLAAATQHSGKPRFMVLDDVTSSFDGGHQISLMEAIRTRLRYGAVGGVPDGLQFIILSHDTSLEKYFDRLGNTTDWHHQKLQGMPPRGRLMVSSQEADRLKALAQQYLNAGLIDQGEPYLRQYLEYKLGQIIARLAVPVPPDYATRGDRRTLSTYIDAITNAVALYQAAGRCVLTQQQVNDLSTHHAPSIMANHVSHYETGAGTPFNAYALLGVLQSVDYFADCFMWTDPSNNTKRYYRALDRK